MSKLLTLETSMVEEVVQTQVVVTTLILVAVLKFKHQYSMIKTTLSQTRQKIMSSPPTPFLLVLAVRLTTVSATVILDLTSLSLLINRHARSNLATVRILN